MTVPLSSRVSIFEVGVEFARHPRLCETHLNSNIDFYIIALDGSQFRDGCVLYDDHTQVSGGQSRVYLEVCIASMSRPNLDQSAVIMIREHTADIGFCVYEKIIEFNSYRTITPIGPENMINTEFQSSVRAGAIPYYQMQNRQEYRSISSIREEVWILKDRTFDILDIEL